MLGLDLSLTSPAAVVVPAGWHLGKWETLAHDHHRPPAPEPGFRGQTIRVRLLVSRLLAFAEQHRVRQAFVEDYAFSARSSSVTKLAELGGVARDLFLDVLGLELVPVTASAWRRSLLGQVPRRNQKVEAQAALYRHRFPLGWCGDVADAFGVANHGRAELGLPFVTLGAR